jgi:cyclophilin family peptidyl-prolyl cis-trans isomerase
VVEGMGVVDAIANIPTTAKGPMQNVPTTDVVIQEVSLISENSSESQ